MAGNEQFYQVLGLEPGATPEEIKRAYRDLAQVWHPDRFTNAPHLRQMAEQKMREINAAYAFLQANASPWDVAGAATQSRTAASDGFEVRPKQATRSARRVDVTVVAPEKTWHGPGSTTCVTLSPDGGTAWAGGNGLRGWDATTGAERREFRIDKGEVTSLCASPCGRYLLYGYSVTVFGAAERRDVRICDMGTGRERVRLKGPRNRLTAADVSPDGNEIVTGDAAGGISLWESASGRLLRQMPVTDAPASVPRVAFCSGGDRFVSLRLGELQEQIVLWDAKTGALVREFTTHVRDSRRYGQIQDVSPAPDGGALLVANNDPLRHVWSLHLWEMTTDREIRAFEGHEGRITQVAFGPNGRWVASGSEDRTVRLWDVASGVELCRLTGASRAITSVACSADSRRILGCSSDSKIYLWLLPTALQKRIGKS